MSVRMRINRSATGKRRSHHKVAEPQLATCVDCGSSVVRHRACADCGKYRGRVVVDVAAKTLKREEKRKAKAEAIAAEQSESAQPSEQTAANQPAQAGETQAEETTPRQ